MTRPPYVIVHVMVPMPLICAQSGCTRRPGPECAHSTLRQMQVSGGVGGGI
jgi:hypothetical protein